MLLARLLAKYRAANLRASKRTLDGYGYTINLFSEHLQRQAVVSDLNRDTVTLFMRWLSVLGRANATVNSKALHLTVLANYALDEGLLRRRLRVDRLPELKRIPEAWTPEQVGLILASCEWEPKRRGFDGPRWKLLTLLIYDTGARLNSILQATKADVRDGCLTLRPEHHKRGIEQCLPLDPHDTMPLIDALPDGPLVPWPWHRNAIWPKFRVIVQRAGLACTRRDLFQKLRRTNLTETAIAHGVDCAVAVAGHTDSRRTLTSYIDSRRLYAAVGIARPVEAVA